MTNIKRSIIAIVMAALIATSTAFVVSSIKVDAAKYNGSAQGNAASKRVKELKAKTSKKNEFAKSYCYKVSANTTSSDWSYKADKKNIKVSGKYDAKAHKYSFKFTGKSYGLNHIVLKYKATNKKWESVKVTLFVDAENNIMREA